MLLESCPTSSGKVSTGLWSFVTTCPEKHFEEKRFFSQKIDFFRNRLCLSENFSVIVKKIVGRPAKTAFRVPIRNIFNKNTVPEKESVSSHFCKSSGKVFALCWSFIRWVVKISFHVSNGTFWGIFFSNLLSFFSNSGHWSKNFMQFRKTFLRNCQNWFQMHVHR